MTAIGGIYRCNLCGNIVEVLHAGAEALVCCGQPMELLAENTTDASLEKHVPVVEKTSSGYTVIVGSTPHPMKPEHYIEWIALVADGTLYLKYLNPGDEPKAEFCISAKTVTARAYCNLHGLWKA